MPYIAILIRRYHNDRTVIEHELSQLRIASLLIDLSEDGLQSAAVVAAQIVVLDRRLIEIVALLEAYERAEQARMPWARDTSSTSTH